MKTAIVIAALLCSVSCSSMVPPAPEPLTLAGILPPVSQSAFTPPQFPSSPPSLYTYGEVRGPNGIERYYAIGVRWDWSWEPVETKVTARYVLEGSGNAAYQVEACGQVWIPRITGRATVYYGAGAWSQEVELR